MRKIWLTWAAFLLAAVSVAGLAPQSRADEPVPPVGEQDHILGKVDAPVTIIEYGSLTCPHCAEFDRVTLPEIKTNWIDTGKARLVFRIFPLNELDMKAATLAHCVPSDRYFAFIDTVYQSQAKWMDASDPQAALGSIARLAGVSEDKIKSCTADKAVQDAVLTTELGGQKAGVDSTPTFFINGVKPPADKNGAQPYDVFNQLLTAAAAKS